MASKTKKHSPCAAPPGTTGAIKKSAATRWRAFVLIAVHVVFAVHIAHLYTTGSTISPLEPSEAMEFSKHSVINAGLIFFSILILSTMIFGRWFCGWGCHLVALQDFSRAMLLKFGIRPRPLRSRALMFVPLISFVYMFLWPFAYRMYVSDDLALAESQLTTSDFWKTFAPLPIAIATFVTCGGIIIYFLGAKGFCTYACPYGAIFGAVDKVAPGRIRVTDACEGCGHCTLTCSSNVQVAQEVRDFGMVVDSGCMKCMDCVSVCPKDALYFGFGKPSAFAQPRREPRYSKWAHTPLIGLIVGTLTLVALWANRVGNNFVLGFAAVAIVVAALRSPKRNSPYSKGEELLLAVTFVIGVASFRGLYNWVPFLFALGIGGILAFTVLLLVRLYTKDSVKLSGLVLKEGGSVQSAGRVFTIGFGLFSLVWAHSAFIQGMTFMNSKEFAPLIPRVHTWFTQHRPVLTAEELSSAERILHRAGLVESWAFRPKPETEDQRVSVLLLLGDEDGFVEAAKASEQRGIRIQLGNHYVDRARRLADAAETPDIEELRAIVVEGLELVPGHAHLHAMHGALQASAGEYEGAVASYKLARGIDPFAENIATQYGELFKLLIQSGEQLLAQTAFPEARRLFELAIDLNPNDWALHMYVAQTHMRATPPDWTQAEANMRNAILLNPVRADLHDGLALILRELGRDDESAAEAAEAVRLRNQ
jgi:ferredoxin/tetratricopeptide (TPR) repeat protein